MSPSDRLYYFRLLYMVIAICLLMLTYAIYSAHAREIKEEVRVALTKALSDTLADQDKGLARK
ncbi:hypothetical protein PP178_02320 [Zeaxanthinibacter sp. PT1]|uniref:hypothetical protein n=1 Tax=Zeaxanthinibacter TaxID=561554 RepID=UPI00234AF829|nr:hypothetical protein [Zeaxanthinibacter sp. PT1]MDC6350370.1 hypothetical protein [Zeaxanthinibacter sp. PT1]